MDEDIKVLEIADPAKQVGYHTLRNIDLVSASLTRSVEVEDILCWTEC
jgi:hypothetical protein